jgi:hypothetical protein
MPESLFQKSIPLESPDIEDEKAEQCDYRADNEYRRCVRDLLDAVDVCDSF